MRTSNARVQRAANNFKLNFDYDFKDFICDIPTLEKTSLKARFKHVAV